jgi:GNAT superfamily N-acetyltransferase
MKDYSGRISRHYNARAGRALKTAAVGGNEAHTITHSRASIALLEKAYKEVYQAAFPLKEEQTSLKSMIKGIRNRKIVISIIGADLNGPAPVLKGMAVGYHYNVQDVGLLGYLATAPQFQGQGLGRAMDMMNRQSLLQAAKARGKKLKGVFLECNPPGTPNDVMDPVRRIAMYEKWGAITLPIFYRQPPLAKGVGGIELKLLAEPHPVTGKYPSKEAIKGYLKEIYTELKEFAGCPPEKNPDYLKSIAELDQLDLEQFYKTTLASRGPKPDGFSGKPPRP